MEKEKLRLSLVLWITTLCFGQNGQSVSGIATIYQTGTSYTLRLGSFSSVSQNGLQAQVYISTSSSPTCTVSIFYYTGNKNYTCETQGGIFTTEVIHPGWRGNVTLTVLDWIPDAMPLTTYRPARVNYGSQAPPSAIHLVAQTADRLNIAMN